MTRSTAIISPKSIGIVVALVVPMLLIPTSGNAKSSRADWHYLDHRVNVKQGNDARYDRNSQRRALDRLFDKPAPKNSKAMNRARHKQLNRSARNRSNKQRRHGYFDNYYTDDEYGTSCVSPRQIHKQLRRQGWRKFHNLRIRPTVLRFKARQRNGLTYNIKVDRCSGSLLKAKVQFKDMWYVRWLRRISAAY